MTGSVRTISPWLEVAGPEWPDRMLLTLTYAGGSGRVFRPWAPSLPEGWGLAMAELPGHGRRLGEPCLRDPDAVVAGLLAELPALPTRRVAVLGYSLGGWLALDLAVAMAGNGTPPLALVVCGARAPHTGIGHPPLAGLPPGTEFLTAAVDLGLADPRMLEVPALAATFADALQADLAMVERYRYTGPPQLDVPLCVLGADEDWLTPEPSLRAWSALATRPPLHARVPGGHLAVETDPDLVGQTVWQLLETATADTTARRDRGPHSATRTEVAG